METPSTVAGRQLTLGEQLRLIGMDQRGNVGRPVEQPEAIPGGFDRLELLEPARRGGLALVGAGVGANDGVSGLHGPQLVDQSGVDGKTDVIGIGGLDQSVEAPSRGDLPGEVTIAELRRADSGRPGVQDHDRGHLDRVARFSRLHGQKDPGASKGNVGAIELRATTDVSPDQVDAVLPVRS